MCLPLGLHGDLKLRLQKSDDELKAWYPTVIARYAGEPIPGDVFRFWNAEADLWVGASLTPARKLTRNEQSIADSAAVIRQLEGRR